MTQKPPDNARPAISILVPVYRGLQVTRECLESIFDSKLPGNTTITVINDNSPEPELNAYCQELAATDGLKVIVNEGNLGFVKSANRGFALEPEADILLLNSDTIVSNDWLSRLQACAYRQPDIGTVTPFTNNGTICSYPVFPVSNLLPTPWTAAELDEAFDAANTGRHCEIPTAVGFCMYIKRSCLKETGFFDEANFGQGYGEECDFSLRASALGWKHAIAADVFVYHEGGASFASESAERKIRADGTMSVLHPSYHQLVSDFLQADPLYDYRRNVDAIRLKDKPADSAAVLEEHYRYTRIILDRVAETHGAMVREQEQRQLLEKMLAECRNQFAETDRALLEAHEAIENLNVFVRESQIRADQLRERVDAIERSRSWRYTAWLRRR